MTCSHLNRSRHCGGDSLKQSRKIGLPRRSGTEPKNSKANSICEFAFELQRVND
jgi:hypothetical protein